MEQVVSPERPDDEPAHEAGRERGEQDGDDDAEVEGPGIDRAMRAPAEAYHATPDRRRQSIPPSSSAKAAIGNMTNAAVNSVTRSRMVFRSSHARHFAKRVPDRFEPDSDVNSDSCTEQARSGAAGLVRT